MSEKDQQPDNEIIADFEILESEVLGGDKYTGVVVSQHEGYSYLNTIKRGYETIATNGDVFTPIEFGVGTVVEFDELNTDPRRPGKFRCETAAIAAKAVATVEDAPKEVILREIAKPTIYHQGAKIIDHREVEQAAKNVPFSQMIRLHKKLRGDQQPAETISKYVEAFIMSTFANLNSIGISYSIEGNVELETEEQKVQATIDQFKEDQLDGQAESLELEYKRFASLRQVFALMNQQEILRLETIVPIHHLPDLLVAAPVWFIDAKDTLEDLSNEDDPEPDHATKFFCNQVKTKEFAWFYQIYNRRNRPLSKFSGRDIIPPSLLSVIKQAKSVFDYTVIATPYHDQASKEWQDPEWLRNIDPFLFGFMKDLPYMIMLGRWSMTGLFPNMLEMVADTMNHLRINKSSLANFPYNAYWHRGGGGNDSLLSSNGDAVLPDFADQVLKAYEEGWLFEFLRGEPKPELLIQE